MTVKWTEPASVTGVRTTDVPEGGRAAAGYGGRIPTASMIEDPGKWRRVYVMVYGNGSTPYVLVKGEEFILDVDTQHQIAEGEA